MNKPVELVKEEFKACWRFPSLKWGFIANSIASTFLALATVAPDAMLAAWAALPADIKALIPPHYMTVFALAIFFLSALNRILKQKAVEREKRIIEATETEKTGDL